MYSQKTPGKCEVLKIGIKMFFRKPQKFMQNWERNVSTYTKAQNRYLL